MVHHMKWRAYGSLVLTFLLWGSLYVVSKRMLLNLPVFLLAFCRFLIAYLFLLLISVLRRPGTAGHVPAAGTANASGDTADGGEAAGPDIRRMTRRYSLLLGIPGYAVFVGLQLIGTAYAGSTTASLINALNPVTITLMAALILGERLTYRKVTGTLLAVCGVYMIVGTAGSVHPAGVICSVASVLGWSLVSVLLRKGLAVCDPLIVTRNALGLAAACNLIFAVAEQLLTGGGFDGSSIRPLTVAGVFYMGICSTGIAYILWNKSLAVLPAGTCSAFYPLQPLTSALLGILFFKETLPRLFFPGTLLIAAGILLCLLSPVSGRRRTIL